MKKSAIKWIIAACAVFFLIGGNAWADGKADRGQPKGGHGHSYQAGPKHPGGHGQPGGNHQPPSFGKQRPHQAHQRPYHRPQGGDHHYGPHFGPGYHQPHHGPGDHRPHYRPHPGYGHGKPVGIGIAHSSYLFSAIIHHPAVAVGVIAGHR